MKKSKQTFVFGNQIHISNEKENNFKQKNIVTLNAIKTKTIWQHY